MDGELASQDPLNIAPSASCSAHHSWHNTSSWCRLTVSEVAPASPSVLVSNSGRWTWVASLTCSRMNPGKAKDVPLLSPSDACRVHPGVDPYTSPLHFAVHAHPPPGFSRAWHRPSDTDQASAQALTACSPLLHFLAYW